MIKARIYKLEQSNLDVIKEHNKSQGISSTNQKAVEVAVNHLANVIKQLKK